MERWREGRIGWHQPDGNASLRRHWRGTGPRVLVPLCGKTPDLVWLAEWGNEVVGVELSEIAVQSFFDAHYDRGALVALPSDLRAAYARHTRSLLAASAEQLLVTLEYDQGLAAGPPYAVHADEVLAYWPELIRIEEHDDLPNGPPKFREAGLAAMIEVIWRSA